jgi:hypothetical protein
MKLRTLSIVCCVVLLRASAAVQSSAAADPVSGNWGSDGVTFLELKFDGKQTVSGTAIWRGDGQERRTPIKTGTFDAKTGALKLEGEGIRPDGVSGRYVIEGTVKEETITGSFTYGDRNGTFKFTRQPAAAGKRTPDDMEASWQARKGDFDYLLGDWEFTADSKEFGKFRGYWSAVRLDEGQILDEYRVVGDAGETYYVTTSLRNYNKFLDQWELIGADAGAGLQDFGTARRVGAEMHIEQKFGATSDRPSIWKIRYYNIQSDRFSWTADRSNDDGKTWEKGHMQIEARRIGPPRSLGALAPARKTQD